MCGIAGVVAYGDQAPPVSREELLRVREAMVSRGPDGAGLWIAADARAGLAHRRLSIIDLTDAGAQPMATVDGALRITFNGEIYNYQQLRKELIAKGYRFHSTSDTEVLLHLYADRGEEMVHALRGMYAFAIWDQRKHGLFLARDPFGIKPLYYSDDGKTLRFASQVKALLQGRAIAETPEAAGYVGFLIWGCVPEPFTLYRDIRSLPAGTRMWVDARGTRGPTAFFSAAEQFAEAAAGAGQDINGGGTAHALAALQDSIRHHMVADVPIAAFLSAGLDSATMVALAAAESPGDLRTLTLGFKEYQGSENDETELAQKIAAHLGVAHESRWVSRHEFEGDLHEILAAMDQPSTDGFNTYFVSKAAAKAGMKVALSGLGGDEILAGYPSFVDVPRIRAVSRAPGFTSSGGRVLREMLSPFLKRFTSPKYAGLFEYGQTHAGAYLLRRALFMPWEIPDIMDPEMAARGWEDLQTLSALRTSARGLEKDRDIVSTLELEWYMRNQLLRDSDWAGMAHSLEIRVPYLDVQFLRAVATIDAAGGRLRKIDLARALNPPLPQRVIERSKTGFLVPVREWCHDTSARETKDRGLRGWAKLIIQNSLAATGAAAARPGPGRTFFAPGWLPPTDPEFRPSQRPTRRVQRRVQASMARASYSVTNGLLGGAACVLWPGRRPVSVKRVCVFRIGNIGDIVCALPAIRAVRLAYPDAHLTLLTSPGRRGMPGAVEVLDGVQWIDKIRVYYTDDIVTRAKRSALLKEMRAQRFDVWIDLPNNLTTVSRQFRDMAFSRMTGTKWARGWRIDALTWAAQAQSEHLDFANEVDRTMTSVRKFGFSGETDFALPRMPHVTARIDDLIRANGLSVDRLVAIAPGAKRSTNLWFPERFVQVGRELSVRGDTIVLIGGKTDAAVCQRIAAQIGSKATSFAGDLSVAESCELLRRCNLVVCLDSGVQHLASAVGTPCISLFSFWQMRGKWHPYGRRNIVLQKWVPCHTCLAEECPNGNLCMKAIEAEEVVRHARQMLDTHYDLPQLVDEKAVGRRLA
jgi:asparagine synthase (glutamine-hydrolysing)